MGEVLPRSMLPPCVCGGGGPGHVRVRYVVASFWTDCEPVEFNDVVRCAHIRPCSIGVTVCSVHTSQTHDCLPAALQSRELCVKNRAWLGGGLYGYSHCLACLGLQGELGSGSVRGICLVHAVHGVCCLRL